MTYATDQHIDYADMNVRCADCDMARWAHALQPHTFVVAIPLWPDQVPDQQLAWLEPEKGKRGAHV